MSRRTHRLVVPLGPEDYVVGNPNAKLTLVEYGDYACPYSRHAFSTMEVIQRRLGSQLRFAFRHFPEVDREPLAQGAAEAALAAGAQGRFWDAHERLFSADLEAVLADPAALARSLDLDVARFTSELREGTHRARVAAEVEGGLKSGVHGTPTFFINGTYFGGSWELHTLLHALRGRLRSLPAERAALGAATL